MPYYQYQCPLCSYSYDDIAPMDSAPPLCTQPVAEGEGTRPCNTLMYRVPGAVSVSIRGGTPTFYRGREHK
jgi:predicted nucleic acid-binding Zn ribbon protein